MTKKYYWAMAVIAAFIVGTIATATPVFAPPPEDDGEGGWKAALDMLPKSNYQVFQFGNTASQGETTFATAGCDEGDVLLSCGFNSNDSVNVYQMIPSYPEQECQVSGEIIEDVTTSLAAYAICADIDPQHEP